MLTEAMELGTAIGEPDAVGCFCTLRWSLVALGVDESIIEMDGADPLWPLFPILMAWPYAVRGDLDRARALLGEFSVLDITPWTGFESLAAAAVVFAAVGSEEQRRWTYEHLLPFAGAHVVVGGCASYHASVDHHLGSLAASLGERAAAEVHLRNAVAMERRLGAAGWARVSQRALDRLLEIRSAVRQRVPAGRRPLDARLRRPNGAVAGCQGPARPGGHIGGKGGRHPRPGSPWPGNSAGHRRDGSRPGAGRTGQGRIPRPAGDPWPGEIEEARELGHTARAGRLADERDALIRELAAATGFGGRDRRLGDEIERARKTVGARLRDSLTKIDRVHPLLATHLRESVRMGTTCSYTPATPTSWKLT